MSLVFLLRQKGSGRRVVSACEKGVPRYNKGALMT